MRERAYAAGRPMTWPRIAERYRTLFESMARGGHLRLAPGQDEDTSAPHRGDQAARVPPIRHFLSLCDDTGLLQHAVHSVAESLAWLLHRRQCPGTAARLRIGPGRRAPLPDILTSRFAAFLQHAWNPDTKRFRNFLGFDRRWLMIQGRRTATGVRFGPWASARGAITIARVGVGPQRCSPRRCRPWRAFFRRAHGVSRCSAWTPIALPSPNISAHGRLRELLANRLIAIMAAVAAPDWEWFEDGLAYDNARLPQALIVTGCSIGTPRLRRPPACALCDWLMSLQTAPAGHFRPVGSQELRRRADASPGLRSATLGSRRSDLRLSRRLARRRP